MKQLYFLSLFVVFGLNLAAQDTTLFWNNAMEQLAEPTSYEGWVFIKKDKIYTSENFFTVNKEAFGLNDNDALVFQKEFVDNLGFTHQRYKQTYKNIEVEACEYILHSANNNVVSANGKLALNLNKEVAPLISEQQALNLALTYVPASKYGWEASTTNDSVFYVPYPTGKLLLAFKENNGNYTNENYDLCYRFEITTIEPQFTKQAIYVNAHSGELVKVGNLLFDLNCPDGTTTTLFNGTQTIDTKKDNFNKYVPIDECRGDGIEVYYGGNLIRNTFNNFSNSHSERVVGSALWATEMAYDYFLDNHGLNSFDGTGAKIKVHAGIMDKFDNAFWTGSDLLLGVAGPKSTNDWTSLDIVGHEFSHAVTQYSAKLIYDYESGALNESFSDIFGTMVEYFGQNGEGDYFIGEDFFIADGKLRDMQNPKSKQNPNTYKGDFWVKTGVDFGGVHTNSAVQNYWFYLLAEGDSGKNDNEYVFSVEGIGRQKAAAIAYRNLSVYLTSSSNFTDAKQGAILAAIDLFGACSNEVFQTIKAWEAVGLNTLDIIGYDTQVDCSTIQFSSINYNPKIFHNAIHNLTSDCYLNLQALYPIVINFVAGNSIELKPGFHSALFFSAYIEASCYSGFQLNKNPDTYLASENSNYSKNQVIQTTQVTKTETLLNSDLLTIFPNPNEGTFTISSSEFFTNLEIVDITGSLIQSVKCENQHNIEVNLIDVQKGMYFVKIYFDANVETRIINIR